MKLDETFAAVVGLWRASQMQWPEGSGEQEQKNDLDELQLREDKLGNLVAAVECNTMLGPLRPPSLDSLLALLAQINCVFPLRHGTLY